MYHSNKQILIPIKYDTSFNSNLTNFILVKKIIISKCSFSLIYFEKNRHFFLSNFKKLYTVRKLLFFLKLSAMMYQTLYNIFSINILKW